MIPEERHAFIAKQCLRLSDGIKKIDDASVQIDVLRVQVEEQRKNVLIAATKCEKMLQGIEQCKLPIFFESFFSIIYFNTKRLTPVITTYTFICTNVAQKMIIKSFL